MIETITSTVVGFVVSFLLQQFVINPLWDLQISVTDNLGIITIFTVASILRGYILRRVFNTSVVKQMKRNLE